MNGLEELLAPARLKSDCFLIEPAVSKMWLEHKSGKRNWGYHLWGVLMFQAWLENGGEN